ncbi:Fc.00g034340.m01.CDS01 [Cosmosporella sp. VM-42]
MFKKKPEIKNLAPLRSSDRRKLADQIIRDYQVSIAEPFGPDTSSSTQTTLSSLRNSLLPDSTSSARFTTLLGPDSALVSGTVYVGAHQGQEERILWFQSGKNPRLIPTIYTLWHNPNIVPLLHTPDFVVDEKLRHGSDFMIPGLVKAQNTKWDSRASAGSVVAVAGIRKDTVPSWVGVCQVDVCNLGDDVRGQKGIAVKALHWAGDECWSWRALGSGGQEPPETLEGWVGLTARLMTGVETVSSEGDQTEEDQAANGGAPLHGSSSLTRQGSNVTKTLMVVDEREEDREPSTQEVDEAFQQAFFYAIHQSKPNRAGPHQGLDFPIQPSFLISNMIQPYLRSQNSQYYTIKKTSWKTAKKFIKHMDKIGLVRSKDRNGGETVILDIDFDSEQIAKFRPYNLPAPRATTSGAGNSRENTSGDISSPSDQSIGQQLTIQIVYRASPKLVPSLLHSKTEFYNAQQVSAALKLYIEQHPDLEGQGAANIKLDPFLANDILGSYPTKDDSNFLAAGCISRSALQKRILDDTHLCQPYHIIMRNQSTSEQKPKPGPPPRIHITVEKRTGTKVVTKVSNLELFFIDPQVLAPKLQKKCAGSASVGQASGSKPGLMEIVVQGDRRKVLIGEILPSRGIDPKWVEVVDKTKSKKK